MKRLTNEEYEKIQAMLNKLLEHARHSFMPEEELVGYEDAISDVMAGIRDQFKPKEDAHGSVEG